MPPLEIKVTGSSTISRPAERGHISFNISCEGPSLQAVCEEVTTTSNQLQQLFKELSKRTERGAIAPDAAITAFTVGSLRSSSRIPHNFQKKEPDPRLYCVTIKFEAIFRDLKRFGEISRMVVGTPLVEIHWIDWRLTDETLKALQSEARKLALEDAIQQARDYSAIVGREVIPVEISTTSPSRDLNPYVAWSPHQPMSHAQTQVLQFALMQQDQQNKLSAQGGSGGADEGIGLVLESEAVSVQGQVEVKFRAE